MLTIVGGCKTNCRPGQDQYTSRATTVHKSVNSSWGHVQ
jgi:hypothetical protein